MSYLRDEADADMEFTASESDDDDAQEAGLTQFRLDNIKDRPPIFEPEAIHDALEDIAWTRDAAWADTQAITGAQPTEIADCNDDIQRELGFYNQALEAAHAAVQQFEGLGVAWMRPADYYAENVKSDGHMAKVKEQLMHETQMIEEAEQRRKDRENKKYSKQVQAEKQKERIKDKKSQIDEITKLRKQRKSSGFDGDLDFDKDMRVKSGGRMTPDKAGQRIRADTHTSSKMRMSKDAKYGFGGRKKLLKQNTAESAASMDVPRFGKPGGAVRGGVSKRGRGSARGRGGGASRGGASSGRGGAKAGGGQGAKRMGKSARDAAKGRGGQRKR